MKLLIEKILSSLGAFAFPAVLVFLCVAVFLWQLGQRPSASGSPIPIKVWEQMDDNASVDHAVVLSRLNAAKPTTSHRTALSTNSFWFSLENPTNQSIQPVLIDFPSRHASALSCWQSSGETFLGHADRRGTSGVFLPSRAGFALASNSLRGTNKLLCRGEFRGPAKISAELWNASDLSSAQSAYEAMGTLIEAGIGILALTMLITAAINKNWLYWIFVGWLLLNMRMAGISAGTDFELFGYLLPPEILSKSRKWTTCVYFSMTVALFSRLFEVELKKVKAGLGLSTAQLAAIILPLACIFISFEKMLAILWVSATIFSVFLLFYLLKILIKESSRVAIWYAASVVVTLASSFSEILSASLGVQSLSSGFNSVTAGIASALLVFAALAEHMRMDHLEKIEAQRTLNDAYRDSPIGLFSMELNGQILKSNPAFSKMTSNLAAFQVSHFADIFDMKAVHEISALAGISSGTVEFQTKVYDSLNKQPRWFLITASTANGITVESSLQDVTEKYIATAQLEFLAHHDPLTECLNLPGIAHSLSRAETGPTALAYFDLDRFKLINDLYGHAVGDLVLRQVCERMQAVIGSFGLLARVGGDEFVVAFTECSVERATDVCNNIISIVSMKPYNVGHQRFSLNVSVGLVGTGRLADSPLKEVISAADTLCRIAKKSSTQRLLVMKSDNIFFRSYREELEIIAYLERGEVPAGLFLVMQPQLSLTRPFESLNFEILLRMRKAGGKVLPAKIVIEAAEMYGKTAIIDRWVVTTAIAWIEKNFDNISNTRFIGINLSGGSLNDEAFNEELFQIFAKHPRALSLICIEITESVALTHIENVQRVIDRIRSLGAKVAIDDFGAGYSSFGYLRGLSVDAVKLDGALVKDATRNAASVAILDAIGSLIGNLGMKSTGEFAEDLPTIIALVNAGIDYAQGYGISRPVMPEEIISANSAADFVTDPAVKNYLLYLRAKDTPGLLFDHSSETYVRH